MKERTAELERLQQISEVSQQATRLAPQQDEAAVAERRTSEGLHGRSEEPRQAVFDGQAHGFQNFRL